MARSYNKRKYTKKEKLWLGRELDEQTMTVSQVMDLYVVSETTARNYLKFYRTYKVENPSVEFTTLKYVKPRNKPKVKVKYKKKPDKTFWTQKIGYLYESNRFEQEINQLERFGYTSPYFLESITRAAKLAHEMADKLDRCAEAFKMIADQERSWNIVQSRVTFEEKAVKLVIDINKLMARLYDWITINMSYYNHLESIKDTMREVKVTKEDYEMLNNRTTFYRESGLYGEGFVLRTPLLRSRELSHYNEGKRAYLKDYHVAIGMQAEYEMKKVRDTLPDYTYKRIDVIMVYNKKRGYLPDADNLDVKSIIDALTRHFTTRDDSPYTKVTLAVTIDPTIEEGTYFLVTPCQEDDIVRDEDKCMIIDNASFMRRCDQ